MNSILREVFTPLIGAMVVQDIVDRRLRCSILFLHWTLLIKISNRKQLLGEQFVFDIGKKD